MPKLKTGSNKCQCSACGEYFNSVHAFDMHRSGSDCAARRCKNPEAMVREGWSKNAAGYWITSTNKYIRR
jgi:hypothetical protein